MRTDRQKDASDFIICSMPCYSNGTDNNQDNVYTAARIQAVHMIHIEQHQEYADLWTKPINLGHESACRPISSASTISIIFICGMDKKISGIEYYRQQCRSNLALQLQSEFQLYLPDLSLSEPSQDHHRPLVRNIPENQEVFRFYYLSAPLSVHQQTNGININVNIIHVFSCILARIVPVLHFTKKQKIHSVERGICPIAQL